jgi:rare lipoprotein A
MSSMKSTRPAAALVIAAAVLAGAGCRTKTHTLSEAGTQTGIASWYGGEFHGRPTSSREVYDMHDLTAAHKTLPLGTQVAVTNLKNGRSIVVRINDRGPFAKNRVIDLSYAAARAIELIGPGTAPVRIEVVGRASPPASGRGFSVQAGAFVSRSNAEALKETLAGRFAGVQIVPFETAQRTYYRVRVRCASRAEAQAVALRLSRTGCAPIVFEEP